MEVNQRKDFDVTSDIYSQVYGGKTSERYRTTQAVEATQGKILIYQGKVFPAYYHATCAGHTEDASLLWNINLPPLKGVVCNFCKDSPHYSWHFDISKNKLIEKLSPAGFKIDSIEDAVILGRDISGRVTKLKISGNKKNIEISAKDLRNILGPNLLRSTNFNVSVVGNDLVFQGLGWGHGVGLCQWGAYFMAKQGAKFAEILKYYYPGAEISSVVK
jgi:stage II sporulation protein D